MKRKFFSLMVAACAAMVSFTGLTGCGGGGGGGGGGNAYLTLDGFANCANGILLMGGPVYIYIEPYAEAEGDIKDGDSTVVRMVRLWNQETEVEGAIATYTIISGTKDAPVEAEMLLTFGGGTDAENGDIMKVFGVGIPTDYVGTITTNITMHMFMGGDGHGRVTYEVSSDSSDYVYSTSDLAIEWTEKVSTWGRFAVTQM